MGLLDNLAKRIEIIKKDSFEETSREIERNKNEILNLKNILSAKNEDLTKKCVNLVISLLSEEEKNELINLYKEMFSHTVPIPVKNRAYYFLGYTPSLLSLIIDKLCKVD